MWRCRQGFDAAASTRAPSHAQRSHPKTRRLPRRRHLHPTDDGPPENKRHRILEHVSCRRKGEGDRGETSAKPGTDRAHVKIQSGLIKLGRAEGCSVWVPPSDRNLSYEGQSFASATLEHLPNFGFDENTRRIVQNIDVLWLIRNVIHRAFEVESTTSIYSGLLRLNDLVLAQPNNQIALFVVAPNARRERVFNQLIRPSFNALARQCQFLTFEKVDDAVSRIQSLGDRRGVRISGLLEGERFEFDDHYVYPTGV